MAETLPEGTDQVKAGTADARAASATVGAAAQADAGDLKARAQAKAGELRGMAADHARDYAGQGKDKATGALDNVAKLIDENASNIDDRLGSQYGDYARRASAFVTDAADGLRQKDVDDLLEDARAFVRRSPGVALAVAGATGFLAARLVRAGTAPEGDSSPQSPVSTGGQRRPAGSRRSAGR